MPRKVAWRVSQDLAEPGGHMGGGTWWGAARRGGPVACSGAWLLLALAAGCAARQYPVPMTAAELAGHGDGAALTAYLGQVDASPAVCDLDGDGPHLRLADGAVRKALDRGLRDGGLRPGRWRTCVGLLLRTSGQAAAAPLLSDVLRAARDLLRDTRLESDPLAQARLEAVVRAYAERPPGLAAGAADLRALEQQLEQDLTRERLGPTGRRQAEALQLVLGLERGDWGGQPVDQALLDRLAAAGDEAALRGCADRLPGATLREEARRRVIRLHVQASPFGEVRQRPAEVEALLALGGANPVALARHALVRAWLEPGRVPARSVVVEQRVAAQTARLLARSAGPQPLAVLPEVTLRGALWLQLAGLSRPVTLCADPRELDPSPCLAPAELTVQGPLARLDEAGALHLGDSLGAAEVVPLAGTDDLVLPLRVAGREVAVLRWPLAFLPPAELALEGEAAGGAGPDLVVRVEAGAAGRLTYAVRSGPTRRLAVVEQPDVAAFRVTSRGGSGRPGHAGPEGMDGQPGLDGQDASCPSSHGRSGSPGGHGHRGGDGGAGGPGGPGGAVQVTVSACGALLPGLIEVLRTTVRSQGGSGGRGGEGGRGGDGGKGGRGGSSTACSDHRGGTSFLRGGLDGQDGMDGTSGFDGQRGPDGAAGPVTIMAEP